MPAGITPERFDEKYIEACFYAWYRAGSPALQTRDGKVSASGSRVARVMPVAEDGRRPDIHTINRWMDKYAWIERADALDAQASMRIDKDVIKKRVKEIEEIIASVKVVRDKALSYFNSAENPFEGETGAAVRAILAGADAIFKYSGAGDRLAMIANMTDKQLEAEALRLLGKDSNDENEDVLEAPLEEIPRDDEQSQDDNE